MVCSNILPIQQSKKRLLLPTFSLLFWDRLSVKIHKCISISWCLWTASWCWMLWYRSLCSDSGVKYLLPTISGTLLEIWWRVDFWLLVLLSPCPANIWGYSEYSCCFLLRKSSKRPISLLKCCLRQSWKYFLCLCFCSHFSLLSAWQLCFPPYQLTGSSGSSELHSWQYNSSKKDLTYLKCSTFQLITPISSASKVLSFPWWWESLSTVSASLCSWSFLPSRKRISITLNSKNTVVRKLSWRPILNGQNNSSKTKSSDKPSYRSLLKSSLKVS